MIHGACVTIGCIPMTNEIIKEMYVLGVWARSGGQLKIPVYIFPSKMEGDWLQELLETEKENSVFRDLVHGKEDLSVHTAFWNNLKTGYDLFEKNKAPLSFSVNQQGSYIFNR